MSDRPQAGSGGPMSSSPVESTSATTTYRRMTVDNVGVFYREAGPKDAPTIVLGGFLLLSMSGPGKYSIDALLGITAP